MFELGADLKLSVPRLLIPWVKKDLVALFMIPKTEIILGTSFQENIGLDKQFFKGVYQFDIRPGSKKRIQFKLIDLEFVNNRNLSNYFNVYKNCTFFAQIILPCLFLVGCSSDYQWGWYVVNPINKTGISNIGFLLSGLQFTIYLSLIAIFFSIIIGLLISVMSSSQNIFLKYFNIGYTEIIRSIPVLVMILCIYYGFPVLFDLNFTAFTAGVIALSICDSPFIAEIFRSGIEAVPKGQKEAGSSLGFNKYQKFTLITLPQAQLAQLRLHHQVEVLEHQSSRSPSKMVALIMT